ncbi:unnamed protein product [Onchocerca ochengi]|uniref:Protein kinase domain-containing protein n=1 Tax=Onchocerca ochengi TaxID=42157 RepID=A0A182EP06_ONCOC|nr:unnamed protein product [Onchocerca ochengi]
MGDEDEIPDFRPGKYLLNPRKILAYSNCKEVSIGSMAKDKNERSKSLNDVIYVIHGQWKIVEKIGAGGCGAVYEVIHVKRKNFTAALKVGDICAAVT